MFFEEFSVTSPVVMCRVDDRYGKKSSETETWYAERDAALDWKSQVIDVGCKVNLTVTS
jgi:hypothetical protein